MIQKHKIIVLIMIILLSICTSASAMTIVLDPGHGGDEPGAIASDGTCEKDINLKIARYLKEYLSEYSDVNVTLTHNGLYGTTLAVFDRGIIARNKHADLFVSLHINSIDEGTSNGAEVYVTANTSLPKYHEETAKLGHRILNNLNSLGIQIRGEGVKTRLIPTDETDVYSDGTRADYYGVIRYAMRGCKIDYGVISGGTPANVQNGEGVPTVLIEHCFIRGSDYNNFLNTDEKIKKLAIADGKAIVKHYGLVKKSDLEVSTVWLNTASLSMVPGEEFQLEEIILPDTAINKSVTWKSNDSSIASIDSTGLVTAKSIGKTSVTATSNNGITAVCSVEVKENPITSIQLDKEKLDLKIGDKETLNCTYLPENTTESTNFTWKSNNLSVATVDSNGNVEAISEGTAIITVRSEKGKESECEVTVKKLEIPLEEISLNKETINLTVNQSTYLTVKYVPDNTTDSKEVVWKSSNQDIVKVNQDGAITAIAKGEAIITATTPEGKSSECKVTVQEAEEFSGEYTLGDINNDGIINTKDAIMVLRYTIGLEIFNEMQINSADVNKSGKIDTKDATTILRYTIGLRDF